MKTTDTHIYFSGGPLSNFYPANFTLEGEKFNRSEQAYMWHKALAFNAPQKAKYILEEQDPHKQKALGRSVSDYVEKTWAELREEVMFQACYAKFSQNPELKKLLLETGDRVLVEAREDPVWGIGIPLHSNRIHNETQWEGENLLGKTLMKVRDKLRNQEQ